MTRRLVREELWRRSNVCYLTYDDGHVVAYGRETDASRSGLWIASLWKGHPLDDKDATHVDHLVADATWNEFQAKLASWEVKR